MTDRPDMSGRFFCTRSPPRLPPPETLHATSLQCPACTSLLVRLRANWAAVRQFVQARLRSSFLSFRPPSRNPGRPFAWYCAAPLPRRCSSSPAPRFWIPGQARNDRRREDAREEKVVRPSVCAGVHPRLHLTGSRIKCGMTARCAGCAVAPLCCFASPQKQPSPQGNVSLRGEPVV